MATARHFVDDSLQDWGDRDAVKVAVLLTSELVTNAVLHCPPERTESEVVVEVDLTARRVRVEVFDDCADLPVARRAAVDECSGRGLQLVEAMSSAWGVTPDAHGGKWVWFEVNSGV